MFVCAPHLTHTIFLIEWEKESIEMYAQHKKAHLHMHIIGCDSNEENEAIKVDEVSLAR